MSWEDANQYCQSINMQLLEIHTEEKQAQVVAALFEMGKRNKDWRVIHWVVRRYQWILGWMLIEGANIDVENESTFSTLN